jgi:hypothetical protein
MATKKEEQGLRFMFDSAEALALDSKGRFTCNFCYRDFVVPEIDIMIRGLSICPSCIQAGPHAVAAEAERTAGDETRIARFEPNPDDAHDVVKEYLLIAKRLRRIDSFADIPGGYVAVAIAYAPPNDPRRPHGGLRPKDVGRGRKAA